MTNAQSVAWKGHKTKKDYTIARNTFNKQPSTYWCTWFTSSTPTNSIAEETEEKKELKEEKQTLTQAELRELRLRFYDKK